MMDKLQKRADEIKARLMKHPKEAIAEAAAGYAAAAFIGEFVVRAAETLSPIIRLRQVEQEIGRSIGQAEALEGKKSKKALMESGRIAEKLQGLVERRRDLVKEIKSDELP